MNWRRRLDWRLGLSLAYMVAGFIILVWHTPWWVWVSVFTLLDAPVLLLIRIYKRGLLGL